MGLDRQGAALAQRTGLQALERWQAEYSAASPRRFAHYRDKPVEFIEEVLGDKVWGEDESRTGNPGQRGVARALVEYDQVAWPKPRGVGGTWLAARLGLWWLNTRVDSALVSTAPTFAQVKNLLWRQMRQASARSNAPLIGKMLTTECHLGENWYGIGISPDDPDNFQGFHADGGLLFLVDEAMGVSDPIFSAADGFTTQPGCKEFYVFNPTRRSGRAFDVCRPNSGWYVPRMSAFDAPADIVTDNWIEARRRQYGPEPKLDPRWWAYVLGDFPPVADDTLISLDLLEKRAFHRPAVKMKRLGVDIARQGKDRCVAVLVEDGIVRNQYVWKTASLMESATVVMRLMKKWGVEPRDVVIDIGMGAGVADRLRQTGLPVRTVDFGSGQVNDYARIVGSEQRFLNRRCELFWSIRRSLEVGELAIPRRWTDLWTELGALGYDYTERDVLYVTPKKELKTMLGRSIDCADALACAMARLDSRALATTGTPTTVMGTA